MSFPPACCNTPPVASDYTAKGELREIGGVPCYVSGPKDATQGIVVVYDIFGMHGNVKQICDVLGAVGFAVVLPDLLGAGALTEADLGKPGVFDAFTKGPGSWEANRDKLAAARDHLRAGGAQSVGALGFCWGGGIVVQALAKLDGLSGGTIVHPALVTAERVAAIKAPLLAMPTKDDPDYAPFFATLADKPFAAQCRVERFDDMFHGFCGARGDWSKSEQAKRANDAIALTADFFRAVLKH
ncbi:hypothetical protein H4R18_005717 [Coemansia javaensis]|uniref:Dienelactone hydrolase domain-containing protein n=1 Tax=Coemansia javaensis TaxID=2761396 RepID=A0A9W8LF56_9FUNG|nr:hypothetical protein H4R18_005717 [Coemansia javaensis]